MIIATPGALRSRTNNSIYITSPKKTIGRGKKKSKGHGRNGADKNISAETVKTSYGSLKHCEPCPICEDGRLYRQSVPGVVVRIKGAAPLQATIYKQEKLRCNICGKVFTTDLPTEAGAAKYDETASAML